jgi:hypothetical protein
VALRKRLLAPLFALVLLVCAHSSEAQFIGYTSSQGVQQQLATGVACTGSPQTFSVTNIGQTQHYLTIDGTSNTTKFQAEIDGFDAVGNAARISDIVEVPPGNAVTVRGSGYYPKVQVVVTCTPAGTSTFTASYSGSGSTFDTMVGAYLTAQIDKPNFTSAAENANQTDTLQTPFGSSAGTIFLKTTVGANGGTIAVNCGWSQQAAAGGPNVFTGTVANSTTLQVFNIPDSACPSANVFYSNNGGAGFISVDYVFSPPGLNSHASTDPCGSSQLAKTSVAIAAAAATTTQIVAAVTGSSIYVCGYQVSQIATAGTLQWVNGTGASCGTGTTNLTGAMGVTASSPISYGGGAAYVMKVPQSNALCLVTTGAGGTAAGIVTFVQAP